MFDIEQWTGLQGIFEAHSPNGRETIRRSESLTLSVSAFL